MFDFPIIDAHIHPFMEPENRLICYDRPQTREEMVQTLKGSGVTACCGSVIKSAEIHDFAYIKEKNQDALRFQKLYPDFYLPGINVHAAFPAESCAEIETMYQKHGVRWIGELVCYMAGCMEGFNCDGLYPVYDLAQQLEMPVNIHQANMADLEPILANFPKLKLVMAHPDEKPTYMARLALMKRYPNLHLDLSGTGLFRWGMLRYGVSEVGAERFLFGTDFPICNVSMNIHAILSEGLTDAENRLIFSENFLRLTGLQAPGNQHGI